MTDEEIKGYIDMTVKRTIAEYKKSGLLKKSEAIAYTEACEIISNFYNSDEAEMSVFYAIQGQRFDPYFRIIPLYFEEKKTVEGIAEIIGVDVSTVVRNKKRLCLAIYNDIV